MTRKQLDKPNIWGEIIHPYLCAYMRGCDHGFQPSVTEITRFTSYSGPTVAKRLRFLVNKNILIEKKRGNGKVFCLNRNGLIELLFNKEH